MLLGIADVINTPDRDLWSPSSNFSASIIELKRLNIVLNALE